MSTLKFTGKQFKALMANCIERNKLVKGSAENLHYPVLSAGGKLIFTDSYTMVSVETSLVTVQSADKQYVDGGLMRLDFDLWEKILVKDKFEINEIGLYKNGKLFGTWKYVNTATSSGFADIIDTAKNKAASGTMDDMRYYYQNFCFRGKYLSRMTDIAEAFDCCVNVIPCINVVPDSENQPFGKRYQHTESFCEFPYCSYNICGVVMSMKRS